MHFAAPRLLLVVIRSSFNYEVYPTIILRAAILLAGVLAIIVCAVTVPELVTGKVGGYAPILIGVYLSLIPFFFALYQALKLLHSYGR
ncbi:MAG: hypothetical protein JWO54_950 [Candidatus Saccharibacteria bacterium]|nr:hypothetical protein [Candidatus Saccharibacteria bacterium]